MTASADPRSLRRLEDPRFLRGDARYLDDIPSAGHAFAAFVRSPHPHAAIERIDARSAAAMPGVLAAVTAADLAPDGIRPIPCPTPAPFLSPLVVPPRPALAPDRVRHVGEPVAMVVASSAVAARDAAERIEVDYRPLPSIVAADAALAPGAPQLWPEAPGNLAYRFQKGDEAATLAAFAAAPHEVRLDLVNNRVAAAPLETRGALAEYDPASARLRLTLSGQDVHGIRQGLAACFDLPASTIHVLCPDVGGGFGMKNVVYPEYVALLWAARRLRRPIRWTADRLDDFAAAAHGRDNLTAARLAFDGAGRFLALHVETIGNLGAYASAFGPVSQTTAPSTAMGGVYAIADIFMDVRGAFTNTAPVDAYRGAGKPEANYLVERLIDLAARRLRADRAALRRMNFIARFPYRTPLGVEIDTAQLHANLDAALAAADYAGFPARRAAAQARGKRLGLGLGCFLETSRGQPGEDGGVRLRHDGAVELLPGTQSNGQGLATSFAQIAAARLGLPVSAVRLVQGDSDATARGGGHGGARSLAMAGTALCLALDQVIDHARAEAARLLQAEPSALQFRDGAFHAAHGASLTLSVLLRALPDGALAASAYNANDRFVFPNGAHVAEAEIDPDTGAVALTRYVAVDDYGVLVNPLLTEGQVQGGLAQGVGQALLESVLYDLESGQLLTASFSDYALPRAADLPAFEIAFNEHPTGRNPLGAKGAGQSGAIGAPQTVINAIADALGVDHIDMPASPERVWRALQGRAGEGARQ